MAKLLNEVISKGFQLSDHLLEPNPSNLLSA